MIFPSYIFILGLLPLSLLGWYGIKNLRARLFFLTAMSYVFYGWWDYRFTLLMFGTTMLDYVCGLRIHQAASPRRKRLWLIVSVAGNLSSLGFFKYYDFFVGSADGLLALLGLRAPLPLLHLVLPLGISFYTFQSMSYTIDIYRGISRPTADFLHFSAYVSMFPQLVAGPIVRYDLVEQQLADLPGHQTSFEDIGDGVWLFVIGLIKKLWIADRLAPVAQLVFDGKADAQMIAAWAGALAYTFQLYFDFSGYSDMARGLGKMLGFQFPVNFNSPYKSADIAEFWNRWHITLSTWLRDYLFIPLGGSRGKLGKTLRNLGITMFLGGLWHGAAWNYVIWGLYHGALLMSNAGRKRFWKTGFPRAAAAPMTFILVLIGWVMFRAPTIPRALHIYAGMLGLHGIEPFTYFHKYYQVMLPSVLEQIRLGGLFNIIAAAAIAFALPNSEELPKPQGVFWAVVLAAVVLVCLTGMGVEIPFLYFQF